MHRFAIVFVLLAGCAGAEWQTRYDSAQRTLSQAPAARAEVKGLAALVDAAVRTHPRVLAAKAKAEAALARASGAGGIDDPELMLKTDDTPFDFRGGMLETARILGVSQTFALGKYGPRADAALAEAEQMVEDYRMACTEIAAQVRTAWAEYYAALREKEVHNKHLDLMKAFVDIAETKYTNGKVSQQDVLEGQSGTSLLHVSLADSDAAAEAAKAALVDLTGAEPPAPTVTATPLEMTLDAVVAQAMANRPDVRGAEAAIRRAASMQTLASRERTIPDVTLQLEYLQMPSEDDAWAATLGINIPWFSSKRGAEERAAGHELDAARRAREAVERAVRREVTAAWHKLKSALKTHDAFKKDLVPRAEQTLDVARSNYEKERVDFLRFLRAEQELRTMELEAARALARVETAWAELERAAGADLRSKP